MEMFGKTLCVTYDELVGSGIMSKSNYKKHVREKKFVLLQKGGNGRKVRIVYESMPETIRANYDAKYPDAKKQLKKQIVPMNERLKGDEKAANFFRTYTPKITIERQTEYMLNVKVLNAMVAKEMDLKGIHNQSGYQHKPLVRDTIIALCESLRERYGHTLPKSAARLIEKYNDYKKRSYVALINGNIGNQVARKVGPKEGRLLLRLKRSKFPVYTDMQIFEEYNRIAEEKGLKRIESPNTVTNYLYKTAVKLWWYASVYGEVAFKNEFMPLFDTQLPEMPNTLWYGDGTKLNLYYKDYDKKQKRMVARTIDVYEVMDACTEVFLGYSFGQENFLTQYDAYRMALETWKVKPYEIVTDNQGGHKTKGAQTFFKKICHLHKTTMPHNGQSKSIESAFGRFQQQVLHKLYNFTGQNVTAVKENSHVNVDLIMVNIERLPTLEEVKEQYIACRNEWNTMDHPTSETGMTRMEMYTSLNSPNAEPLEDYEVADLFKIFSTTSVKYGKDGYCFEIDKKEYRYQVYDESGQVDLNFHMQNVGESFRYRYDPKDMTVIELWRTTATGLVYETDATPKVKIHRATAESSITQNAEQISLKVTSTEAGNIADGKVNALKSDLQATGIDIANRKVTVTADTFRVQDNYGNAIAVFKTNTAGKPILRAENIDVDNLVVKKLAAVDGTIGGFKISANSIGTGSTSIPTIDKKEMFLYDDMIGFNSKNRQVIVGPFSTMGVDYLGRFYDHRSRPYDINRGVSISVAGGRDNIALATEGGIVVDGKRGIDEYIEIAQVWHNGSTRTKVLQFKNGILWSATW